MKVVIVGSGIAGVTLADELRKNDTTIEVVLVTMESRGYYSRPLLSHGFSREDIEDKIVMRSFDALAQTGITVHLDTRAMSIDRSSKILALAAGENQSTLSYDILVLALGSAALIPPPLRHFESCLRFVNSLDDLIELRRYRSKLVNMGRQPKWAIIGGGLIGCEVASDLAKAGDKITLFHALDRLMERQLEPSDSDLLYSTLKESGIEINLSCPISRIEFEDTYQVSNERACFAGFDAVIAACGFKPRTALAEASGLPVERGIMVDQRLRTIDPAIFACGDVAQCPDGKLYAYVTPVRNQALWLASHLSGKTREPWTVPFFKPKAKVHGFNATLPYLF